MSRLLSADFAKLRKNKFFWICMAGMFLFGVFMAIMDYISTLQYGDYEVFSFPPLSVFSSERNTATGPYATK